MDDGIGFILAGAAVWLVFALAVWITLGVWAMRVGAQRSSAMLGLALGLALGIFGVILAYVIDNRRTCRWCGWRIGLGLRYCDSCRRDQLAPDAPPPLPPGRER